MIRMEVQGLQELERQLQALGEKVAGKVMSAAGKEAMQIVQEDMLQHAGYDESSNGPHMRDSIKVSSRNRMKDERWQTVVTIRVGPSKEHTMKALAQEFGTVKQVADPFMRPALDYNRAKVLRILAVRLREGIENNR
ncbi:HK97 gp10 family phage protein [Citrobacter sp. RHBSTW-00599]|uniref:HK97-gp10 family putative phage morphogenesis protein n=1 Tax=Citrobacter sp. RHBSTW-00599 TaxID=2742657 RepID=UPI0015E9CC8B|nr:HK97-gp10 family putative phage morphogenesis protein [Citrobacter sp. RHBSTW-00599]QLY02891.1 HK97 gp10 family phage protein [Citrobacter sp. RHBSTW-00599]